MEKKKKSSKKVGRPKLGKGKTVTLGACFETKYANRLKKDGEKTGLGYAHFIRLAVEMMYDGEVK